MTKPCSICDQLPASVTANTGRGESLPAATRSLKHRKDWYGAFGTSTDLWECPECGDFYIYTTETAFTGSGNNDDDTLERLSHAQSVVVRAMIECNGDPAAIEDAVFELPPIAFEEALNAAYQKDREFVALLIPRLVLEYARQGYAHPAREVLHALVQRPPTFAREVLAATATLPPDLRARLADLESRCTTALA